MFGAIASLARRKHIGAQTVIAGLALLVAAGLLIYFFATENETADKASNWFFLVFYGLMAWTVVEVHGVYVDVGAFVWVLTIVGLAALTVLFVGTLLIVLNVIDFRRVAMITTGAFLIVMLWMLAISILIVTQGGLPDALGWLGIGVMALSLAVVGIGAIDRQLMMGEKTPGPGLNTVYGLILVGLTVWIVWLGAAPVTSL